jgi:acyl-CoA-binding protein
MTRPGAATVAPSGRQEQGMAFDGTLDEQFAAAQEAVKGLAKDPGDELKLQLYALYKQATAGDVSGKAPSRFDFVGRAKFSAWEKLKGSSGDSAKQGYVDAVSKLLG